MYRAIFRFARIGLNRIIGSGRKRYDSSLRLYLPDLQKASSCRGQKAPDLQQRNAPEILGEKYQGDVPQRARVEGEAYTAQGREHSRTGGIRDPADGV